MSQLIVIALAIVSIAVTTCRALPDIHKQMSPQQLQSIFHVDSHDAVPQYEIVQLLHEHSADASSSAQPQYSNYRRRRRSLEELSPNDTSDAHHVKKDLSKTPYFSEVKMSSKKANSLHDGSKRKHVKDIHEHKVQLTAFGEKLNLTLKKTQGLYKKGELHKLPMWYMNEDANATHGVNLEKIEDEHSHSSDDIGEVYQDEENMAAILMRRHEITGDLVMEGSIGHDMVIKPLPHELSPQPEESHHVIYKRSVEQMEHLSDFAYMEPDDMATHGKLEKLQERQKRAAHFNTLADIEEEQEELEAEDGVNFDEHSTHKRAKRSAPYMIYPEVLVIVDYDGYRLHGGDNLQVKRYFIAFWNGVDLRYRLLKEPKIRVSIAGIIISRGRDATPYLERNRVGRDAIDSAAALTDMGKYLFRERRLPVYDIAVAITKYDMCRRRKGGRCTKGTAGFAYVGGACVVNRRLEKVNSVAIIEDTGGFSGIIVAAHEVGHLLGAVHDGSPPPSYLGGPGAQRCRWEDGFIMSDLRHTERGFRWSACSVQSFQHFLNGATATCLYNVPHEDNALGRSLPGTLLSLDAQCRRDRGTYACFKDERVCAQLFCFDAQTGYCVAYRPAAEGSTCGNNMHCLDGRCTTLPVASNLITNYGGQYNRGYKSNEAIGDDNETKDNSSQSNNSETEEDEEDDEDDDEEEPEDEDADEEEEDEEEEDEKNENQAHDNSSSSDEGLQDIEPKNIEEENDEQEEDQSEENTSDAYESREQDNSSSASPRGFGENDDDEEYLTDDENIEEPLNKHVDEHHNYIDKPHPHDNRYEETMVKRKDNERDHRERTSTTPVFNLNTYQYLSQLWQNLQTFTSTTTTTTTTKKPKTVLQKHTPLQQPDYDDFKSLIRSGMSLKGFSDSRRNVTTTRNTLQQQHYTDISTTPRNIRTPPPHLSNRITTTTTRPTPQPTSNFIKTLRKQFQYYVKLLQTNNSNNNNNVSNRRSTSSSIRSTTKPKTTTTTTLTSINKTNYNSHTILPSKPYSNNSVNNAASKQGSTNNENGGGGGDDDDEDDDDDDDDDDNDSGDDNDESNETIEKQKRKLNIPISTTTMQQQQQPLQASPHHPTPSTSYKAPTSAATDTPQAAAPHYGIRSVVSNPTLFETYIKKLQALNDEDDGDVEVDEVTEATLTRTTSDGQSKTLDKTERTIHPTAQLGGGDFFKRTPSSSSGSSSISSHNKSPYTKQIKTTTTGRGSTSANGSSYKFISPQQQKQQQQALKIIAETERQTSSPAVGYVTNYIGDNTNRLASIVQNQQQPQHHHHPQHQTQTLYQQQQQKNL